MYLDLRKVSFTFLSNTFLLHFAGLRRIGRQTIRIVVLQKSSVDVDATFSFRLNCILLKIDIDIPWRLIEIPSGTRHCQSISASSLFSLFRSSLSSTSCFQYGSSLFVSFHHMYTLYYSCSPPLEIKSQHMLDVHIEVLTETNL